MDSAEETDPTTDFELECLFDDPDEPSEVTIFSPGGERIVTEWITADRTAAVALDRIR